MKINILNLITVYTCKFLVIIIPKLEGLLLIINYFLYVGTYLILLMQNKYVDKHIYKTLGSNFLFFIIDELPQMNIFWLNYDGDTLKGVNLLIYSTILLMLSILCGYRAKTAENKSIPQQFSDKIEEKIRSTILDKNADDQTPFHIVKRAFLSQDVKLISKSLVEQLNFCKICSKFKPQRCVHCYKSNRCVLKFDHYSLLLDTCIGFHNIKYLYLMQIYIFLTMMVINSTYFIFLLESWVFKSTVGWALFVSFVWILQLFTMLGSLYMVWVRTFLIFRNQTRHEFQNKIFNEKYDMGQFKNFEAVMGQNKLFWFLPMMPNLNGGGIKFILKNKKSD